MSLKAKLIAIKQALTAGADSVDKVLEITEELDGLRKKFLKAVDELKENTPKDETEPENKE